MRKVHAISLNTLTSLLALWFLRRQGRKKCIDLNAVLGLIKNVASLQTEELNKIWVQKEFLPCILCQRLLNILLNLYKACLLAALNCVICFHLKRSSLFNFKSEQWTTPNALLCYSWLTRYSRMWIFQRLSLLFCWCCN